MIKFMDELEVGTEVISKTYGKGVVKSFQRVLVGKMCDAVTITFGATRPFDRDYYDNNICLPEYHIRELQLWSEYEAAAKQARMDQNHRKPSEEVISVSEQNAALLDMAQSRYDMKSGAIAALKDAVINSGVHRSYLDSEVIEQQKSEPTMRELMDITHDIYMMLKHPMQIVDTKISPDDRFSAETERKILVVLQYFLSIHAAEHIFQEIFDGGVDEDGIKNTLDANAQIGVKTARKKGVKNG